MATIQPNSKRKIFFIIGALLLGISAMGALANNKPVEAATVKEKSTERKPDALTMMETVFVGEPSRAEVQAKMDKLLTTYKMEVSEENYNKMGSMLVSLRKDSKTEVSEMELADAAGLCAVLLEDEPK